MYFELLDTKSFTSKSLTFSVIYDNFNRILLFFFVSGKANSERVNSLQASIFFLSPYATLR